jgi:predicted nucleic acid-binding protein
LNGPEHMYWDSCVFFRYLTNEPFDYVDDIHRFVQEAKKGERKIHCSTLFLTEVRHFALKKTTHKSVAAFFEDLRRAVSLIEANPNVLIKAGALKDVVSTNPSDRKAEKQRVIGTADAIHFATCLYLKEVRGLTDIVFHTFDDGKGATWEGRCVSLLSFERWYPSPRSPLIQSVCDLPRVVPKHPDDGLFSGAVNEPAPLTH